MLNVATIDISTDRTAQSIVDCHFEKGNAPLRVLYKWTARVWNRGMANKIYSVVPTAAAEVCEKGLYKNEILVAPAR